MASVYGRVRRFLRHNGLSLALGAAFLVLWLLGQVGTGMRVYNDERRERGQPELPLWEYLQSAHFAESTTENWESEFLQMGVYVLITVWLFQKGSAESNDPDAREAPRKITAASPWPARRGGWIRTVYSYSLSLAFVALFLVSFVLHAMSGARLFSEEEIAHGRAAVSTWEFFGHAQFWFESFQNWQSEFLAIGSMVVLSIFLRQRGSPESKPVEAPHGETGA